jgi:hypothetical protein
LKSDSDDDKSKYSQPSTSKASEKKGLKLKKKVEKQEHKEVLEKKGNINLQK